MGCVPVDAVAPRIKDTVLAPMTVAVGCSLPPQFTAPRSNVHAFQLPQNTACVVAVFHGRGYSARLSYARYCGFGTRHIQINRPRQRVNQKIEFQPL